MTRHILLAALGVVLVAVACDSRGDDDVCTESECVCRNVNACDFDCQPAGCRATCSNASRCQGRCTERCTFACHDTSNCSLSCGDACRTSCYRASDCRIDCGSGCQVDCADVSLCRVRLREGAVRCARTGSCDVRCVGPNGTENPATDCGDGRFVCGAC